MHLPTAEEPHQTNTDAGFSRVRVVGIRSVAMVLPIPMNGAPIAKCGIHLLVVEDSPLMRGRIVEQLWELGEVAGITEAEDVPTAIASIDTISPHVVILDFHMPGGNGLDVIRAIRRRNASVTIIIFTSHCSEQIRAACLAEGADFFFSKSGDFSEVEVAVRDVAHRLGAGEGDGSLQVP